MVDSLMLEPGLVPVDTPQTPSGMIDALVEKGMESIANDFSNRQFNRMLFDHVRIT